MASRTEQIDAYLDGMLDDAGCADLEAALVNDLAVRDLFVGRSKLNNRLRNQYALDRSAPKPDAEAPRSVGVAPGSPVSAAGAPIYRKGYEPQPSRFPPLHYALAGVAAALLVACGLAIYLLAFNAPTANDPVPSQPGPAVATLIENTGDLRTPHGFASEGNEYAAGEYALDSGTAQVLLTNLVTIDLRGKTRLVVHGETQATLTEGEATFNCPKGTEGYTVHLPSGARVVDLGTRFMVKIDDSGEQIVYVSQGLVELHQNKQLLVIQADHAFAVPTEGQPTELSDERRLAIGLPRRGELIADGSFEVNTNTTPGRAAESELGATHYAGSQWGTVHVTTHWSKPGERTWYMTDNGTHVFPNGDFAYRLDASDIDGVDALSQDGIVLTAGLRYKLSFAMWGDDSNPTNPPRINVTLTGPGTIQLFKNEPTDTTDGQFEIKSVTFTPKTTGSYRLSFAADEPDNGNSHTWIDDVSLVRAGEDDQTPDKESPQINPKELSHEEAK